MHIKFFLIVLILKIHLVINVATKQFHEHLSTEDLRHIFHVESISDVPEYDITSIRSRIRRSSTTHMRTVHLKAFGEKKILNLRPNEYLSRNVPVYFADATADGTSGVTLSSIQTTEDIGIPYQDESSMAAVLITHHPDSGDLLMDGTVGEELVVRPIPYTLQPLIPRGREEEQSPNALYEDEAFLDDGENLEDDLVFSDGLPLIPDDESVQGSSISAGVHKSVNGTNEKLPDDLLLLRKRRSTNGVGGYHVVYKRKAPVLDSDYALLEPEQLVNEPVGGSRRNKRDAPYVIYPEILVLVDYDGYLLHGEDNNKIKSYYVSFWNGADLRYKLLKSPKVKVSIAGIIISRSRDAMPYLERNRVGRDSIDSASALTDMGKYLYQERRLPTYDVAVAITKLDMCRRPYEGGPCNRGTAGFAYVGGACVVNKRLQKVNSVAIVEDTGGFSGIIVAAHEVGHLLGAVHDGSPPPSYLGGPGARRCRWKDGFIMSDLRHTEKGFRWSTCSVEQFHHFLNGETATCLYNLPNEDESLPRILPGKLMSLDAQCRKDRGTSACFKDDRVCAQLFCFDKTSGYCVSYRPAAEGSDCGDGKICLNGKCVYDDDNSITDLDIHRFVDNHLVESSSPVEWKSRKDLDIVIFSNKNNINSPAQKQPVTTKKPYALENFITSKLTTTTTAKPTFTTKSIFLKPFITTTKRPTNKFKHQKPSAEPTSTTKSNFFKHFKITTKFPTFKFKHPTSTTKRPTTTITTRTSTARPKTLTTHRLIPTTATNRPKTTTASEGPTTTIASERPKPTTASERTKSTTASERPKTTTASERPKTTKLKSYDITTPTTFSTHDSLYFKTNQVQTTKPSTKKSIWSGFWTTAKKKRMTTPRYNPTENIKITTFKPKFNSKFSFTTKSTMPQSISTTTKKVKYVTLPWTRWLTSSKSPKLTWPSNNIKSFKKGRAESTTALPSTKRVETTTNQRSNFWDNKWKKTKRTTHLRTTTPGTTSTTTTTTTTTPRTTTKHINRISGDEKSSKKSLNVVNHDIKCQDVLRKIAGGLSCRRFLESYGYRYCRHKFMHKNCCRSRAEVCD